jgi:hypothetical protein
MIGKVAEYILAGLLLILLVMFIYLLVLFPVKLKADADCFSKGYPKSLVSYNLDSYCVSTDGSVTVKAIKNEETK